MLVAQAEGMERSCQLVERALEFFISGLAQDWSNSFENCLDIVCRFFGVALSPDSFCTTLSLEHATIASRLSSERRLRLEILRITNHSLGRFGVTAPAPFNQNQRHN